MTRRKFFNGLLGGLASALIALGLKPPVPEKYDILPDKCPDCKIQYIDKEQQSLCERCDKWQSRYGYPYMKSLYGAELDPGLVKRWEERGKKHYYKLWLPE